jgi:hypothetical protein
MHDAQTRLRAALQFLRTSDIPAEHKGILLEAVTLALREQHAATIRGQAAEHSADWRPDETAQLRAYLQGRVATSWQQADETALHLAAQLQRQPDDVRAKALELGFGSAVDFRVAKAAGRE